MSTAESEKISSEGGMSPVGDVNRKYLKEGQSMEEEASRLRLVSTKFVIFCCLLYPVGPVCVRDCQITRQGSRRLLHCPGDVFGYNGAGSNHDIVSDGDTGVDDCVAADPDIVPNA